MDRYQQTHNFIEWIKLKIHLDRESYVNFDDPNSKRKPRYLHDGEIWWCSMGENIGVEVNGKNEQFSRPIVIYQRLGGYAFMGIPLTSQPHTLPWFMHFKLNGRDEYAALCQAQTKSVARLRRKMGKMSAKDFKRLVGHFDNLYVKNKK